MATCREKYHLKKNFIHENALYLHHNDTDKYKDYHICMPFALCLLRKS